MIKNQETPQWLQGLQSTLKIAIFHTFVISEGNVSRKNSLKFFFLIFLVEFQLYIIGFMQVYVVLLFKKYSTSKFRKKFFIVFSWNFMNPTIFIRALLHSEMSLKQVYSATN